MFLWPVDTKCLALLNQSVQVRRSVARTYVKVPREGSTHSLARAPSAVTEASGMLLNNKLKKLWFPTDLTLTLYLLVTNRNAQNN
jgi:hypothetical protein